MAKRDYQTFAHCKILAGCGGSWRFKKANGTFVTKRDTDELRCCGVYSEDFVAHVCRHVGCGGRDPNPAGQKPLQVFLTYRGRPITVVGFQTFSEVISEAERRRDVSGRTCGGLP